ncbi:MAG: phenylalanine--tRNA ligase subunit beta [Campylobacterales bacterium]|nr:phenylalanine--tRNA ligase subunit beta [Campylobacterales bacterium]
MIVTRQWLQEYIDISKISTDAICKALNSIGLEVDSAIKNYIPSKVVVGLVEDCQKHPDADKLNVCQVNLGDHTTQIVCGAKNVASGQHVCVATIGAILGEDFKIKKAKLRGVESNGMICSSTEIGLPKLNDGIMVLDSSIGELVLGKELIEYAVLNDDIIAIELTANRGDCLSIHGIARELATYFNLTMNKLDFVTKSNNKGIGQIFEASYDSACEANLSYKAANISKFDLPLLYSIRCATADIVKNTTIETAIAYATHSTGVILNVYTKSIANQEKSGLVSLEIKKDANGFDTVYGKIPLSTIGIQSGKVEALSDEVIIEASYIDPEKLSVKVFDKKIETGSIYYKASRGSEPNLSFGLNYLISLLSKNGATIFNGSQDFFNEVETKILNIQIQRINEIIGQEIEKNKIIKILASLGFEVKVNGQDLLAITIPQFRHDIKNIADITEEIVRIVGIDQIKSKPLVIQEINRDNNASNNLVLLNNIRSKAIVNGFFETITYVFTNKELLLKYDFPTVCEEKEIKNPIVNELNTFRTTLAINLVLGLAHNVNLGFKSIGLFEYGTKFDANRNESKNIGFIFSGDMENETLQNRSKPAKIDFFGFCQKISNTIGAFELENLEEISNKFIHPYQSAKIIQNGNCVGIIYKLHPTVCNDFDIPSHTFICELEFEGLSNNLIFASNISKFQASKRDLSIVVPKNLEFKEIRSAINQLNIEQIKQYNLVDIYSDEKLDQNESLTLRFVLQSDVKTMEESEINDIMEKITTSLKEQFNIGLR